MKMHQQCSWDLSGAIGRACTNEAEWVFALADGSRGQCCQHHLPHTEDQYPDAMILPLDTENH